MDATNKFLNDLDCAAGKGTSAERCHGSEARYVVEQVLNDEAVQQEDDEVDRLRPTWGYFVFLTDDSEETLARLPMAMENWVRVVQSTLHTLDAEDEPPNVYGVEAFRRFKFDLVEDQEELACASYDRVRANFRALIQGFPPPSKEEAWTPPARTRFCLVLNADSVEMLANLSFHSTRMEDFVAFEQCTVPAVAISWERPELTRSSYRGIIDMPINALDRAYHLVDDGVWTLEEFGENEFGYRFTS